MSIAMANAIRALTQRVEKAEAVNAELSQKVETLESLAGELTKAIQALAEDDSADEKGRNRKRG
jgi:hypothetical protein